MNNEITPIDLIIKINELKQDLEILAQTTNKAIYDENTILKKIENLNNSVDYSVNDLNQKIRNIINNQIEVLSISIKDTINEIKSDLITTTKSELEKDINYKLSILSDDFKTAYKTIFNNAYKDLKAFNKDLENSKNLEILKTCNYQLIQQQKELITNHNNIYKSISYQLNIFEYMFNFKWFVMPLLGFILGVIITILINKYILINYFNYYQTEQTATAIAQQNQLIAEQQKIINDLELEKSELKKYNVSIHKQNNKVYLMIDKKNYKNNLIENANKNYSYIELIK